MTDKQTRKKLREKVEQATGVEEILSTGSAEVFHEHGVHTQALNEVGDRITEGREKAVTTLETVEDEIEHLMRELLGTGARAGVYVALSGTEAATPEEVTDETGLSHEEVKDILENLQNEGFIKPSGDGYAAVRPTELVIDAPERVGEWISSSIRDELTETEGRKEAVRLPVRGEKPDIEADYTEEEGEITVRVQDPGDADYVSVLVGSEVRHRFEPPSPGDEVTVDTEPEDAVVAQSGRIETVG